MTNTKPYIKSKNPRIFKESERRTSLSTVSPLHTNEFRAERELVSPTYL